MPIYVVSLQKLHNSLTALLGKFPLYADTYKAWVDAVANHDDPDELDFILREDSVFYTEYEREVIVDLVTNFFYSSTNTTPDSRISYDISIKGSSLVLKEAFNRKDREILKLKNIISELKAENLNLTLQIEAYTD